MKRRRLYRLDPRQVNSLPALRRSKLAACPQAVPARKIEIKCPSFELPDPNLDPDPDSVPESEPDLKLETEPDPVSTHPQPPLPRS